MPTLIKTKEILRKEALKVRKELFLTGKLDIISKKIVSKILLLEEFKAAQNIALYYPLQNEINLLELLKVKDKSFFFPRCKGLDIEFAKYEKNGFSKGNFGIMEPANKAVNPQIFDIIFTPALIANTNCYRLGWGKGYYDRFFYKSNLKAKKIIVIPFLNLNDEFVEDSYDMRLDTVLTEKVIV